MVPIPGSLIFGEHARCSHGGGRLKPGAPRRIQDPGQPRRPFAAPDRTPVVPTNEQMERDEQPPERKSLTLHVLRDLAILLAISLVWKEPLLAFTHDFKDFFNQLHLHPSQTWMATILWSEAGRMRHYIEKSLAFGQKKSSNYAQRWANAVITIMWSRFDAEERKLFDAETDPERRAVINQRDALSTLTGRNEMRCAAAHVYTDDTIGLVVGFERFVRLQTALPQGRPQNRASRRRRSWAGRRPRCALRPGRRKLARPAGRNS